LWQSALGLNIRFYRPLAKALCQHGISVTLIEQRGHGDSPVVSSRGVIFGVDDLVQDVTDIHAYLQTTYPDHKFVLAGHSLGGHLSILAATRLNLPVITVACALPYFRWFTGAMSAKILFLCGVIKLLVPMIGYYPGKKVGFGGHENAGLMKDWSHWAMQGNYGKLQTQCASWKGLIHGIDIIGDDMAPASAAAKTKDLLPQCQIHRHSFKLATPAKAKAHSHWCRDNNTEPFAKMFADIVQRLY
jgi:predicted alpha/beta hydrolase